MALKADCEHTDQFIICPTCEPDDDKRLREVDEQLRGKGFKAMFPGRCGSCGEDVQGQRIVIDEESGLWVHEETCA